MSMTAIFRRQTAAGALVIKVALLLGLAVVLWVPAPPAYPGLLGGAVGGGLIGGIIGGRKGAVAGAVIGGIAGASPVYPTRSPGSPARRRHPRRSRPC
jgi:hypothetical protein